MTKTAHIIGAGISGLAAAVRLANAGFQVHVHEATQQAGGRCRSYFDAQTQLVIDNGNHLLLSGNSHAATIYDSTEISERHRHRYEVNVHYRDALEKGGLAFSGMSPDGQLPEIVERPDHPWFVGVQFHPELKSKPFDPHPLFKSFIAAAVKQSRLV